MDHATSAPLAVGVAGLRSALAEVERLARYGFAAQLARGRRVLDVACGVGDGSLILAEADATEVVGVDHRAAMIDVAHATGQPNLRFRHQTTGRLEFPADSFGLVVCLEGAEVLLPELARVLAHDGVLVVSDTALEGQWPHVRVLGEESWVGSAVLDESERSNPLDGVEVRGSSAAAPARPHHTLVLASVVELPEVTSVAALAGAVDVEAWLRGWDERLDDLDRQRLRLEEQATIEREREQLRERLIEAEASAERALQLEADLEQAQWRHGQLQREVDALDEILKDVMGSFSWRITEPLRALKRRFGGSR